MKRKYIIIILWGLWFCSLIGVYLCVNQYIDNKRIALRKELREKLSSLFEGQDNHENWFVDNNDGFFDEAYSGKPVRNYKQIDIPPKPTGEAAILGGGSLVERWETDYGDLMSLYELNWGDAYPNQENEGWNIIRLHFGGADDELIQTNTLFPYKVGMKRNNWGITYSVEEAVDDAFGFYTTNNKSGFADRFQKGSNTRLWSQIYDCCNKYYSIVKNENYNGGIIGTPICMNYSDDDNYNDFMKSRLSLPYENGCMYNGYYKVFIAATQENRYMISENEWAINKDRNTMLLWWGLGLTLLFFSIIIPLMIVEKKSKKKKSETLYQRLSRLCNPKEFMKNYDRERVDKANSIYHKLMSVKPNDQDALMELQEIAVSELGITLIDMEEVEELKEKVNPKRFLNPYNAEKVALANELYAILSKEGLTYNEFVEVEEKAKSL